MKKFIVLVLLVLSFSFAGNISVSSAGKSTVDKVVILSEIERIEYVCIDGQWYMIIYYTDIGREIYPITAPPLN